MPDVRPNNQKEVLCGFGPLGKRRLGSISDKAEHDIVDFYGDKIKNIQGNIILSDGKIWLTINTHGTTASENCEIANFAKQCLEAQRPK